MTTENALIEAEDLHALLHGSQKDSIRMVDATYGVPGFPDSAVAAHEAGRIGNAVFFNIDTIADPQSPFPHSLPDEGAFAETAGLLGIGNDDHVVVYDQTGLSFAAARAWWMFRVFGHQRVSVLNGGLPAWTAAGYGLETAPAPAPHPVAYKASFKPELYRSYEDVEELSENGNEVIVDARAAARFSAQMRSPDGDAVPAHIPGSRNQPFDALLDASGKIKPANDLKDILKNNPQDSGKKIVVSCGSGVTACVLALGFFQTGITDAAVFDGSWTEWSARRQLR